LRQQYDNNFEALSNMPQDQNHLVWLDMEMSGLDPDSCRILEVAVVVTDKHLETIAEGPVLVVRQVDAVLNAMDEWNKNTHGRSGLIEKVKASLMNEAEVATACIKIGVLWSATCRN
jgi:oligoribonuclease